MPSKSNVDILDDMRARAESNVNGNLQLDCRLPDDVFSRRWSAYMFFSSDQVFKDTFVDVIKGMIDVERSSVACLRMLDSTSTSFFIDQSTTLQGYKARLIGSGPVDGWLYGMERFGCASATGSWCIYCEKNNEIAVIAMNNLDRAKFGFAMKEFHAFKIADKRIDLYFPFYRLTPAWRKSLMKNY